MRIALLHYTTPPVIGGVERVVADHARLFAQQGHEVSVLCGEGSALADPRIKVIVLPALRRGGEEPLAPDELIGLLRRQEIVFLHNVLTMPFHLALTQALWDFASTAARPRLVAWVHDVAAGQEVYAPVPPLLTRAHPEIEYVAVSALRRSELCAATGLPAERCQVIPNGLHPLERLRLTPPIRRLAEEWAVLEREIVLFQPTRLLGRKNVEFSLRVLAALAATRGALPASARPAAAAPLLLITAAADSHHAPSSAYAQKIRRLRAALRLEEDVCFINDHCTPTDADVDSLYTLADALFYPSLQEGFGLPVLEAAMHRLPIFCSDLAPLNGLLPPESLTLFDPTADHAQIAAVLRRQLEGSRTIRNRKAAVRSFGWAALYHDFLAPLLARPHPFLYL